MSHLFEVLFYQPILNLLVGLYNTIAFRDLGVAILILTVVIKLVLWPLSHKSIKSQKSLQDLQPKINEVKKKHPNDKQQQGQAMIELYKEHKVNPFSSCLPLLLQFPFLIAVFQVFRDGITNHLGLVYPFVHKPEIINPIAFGFLDLSKPNIYLAILAGLAQFWQAKMMMAKQPKPVAGSKEEDMSVIMNKQMLYFMPILTVFIGITLPGGLSLYWLLTTLLTGLQQYLVFKSSSSLVVTPEIIEAEIIEKK